MLTALLRYMYGVARSAIPEGSPAEGREKFGRSP